MSPASMAVATRLFWVSGAVVFYTYAIYPLLMALLARLRLRPRIHSQAQLAPGCVSIVMAVHNGAGLLPWKLKHLLALEPELVAEVIVVSDGSTDETTEILRSQTDARLRSVLLAKRAGKGAALNQGVALASSPFVLFVDIRPRIASGALRQLLGNFADPTVGCATGELVLHPGHQQERVTSAVGGLYWRYEQWIRTCEAAWDSPVGVYGGFYAARRALLRNQPPGIILDDMFQPLSIIRQGFRSVLDSAAVVEDTWPPQMADEFARKVRTLAGNFQLFRLMPWALGPDNRVAFQLWSHKVFRLVVPWCLMTMLWSTALLSVTVPAWRWIFAGQCLVWLLALLSIRFRLPLISRLGAPLAALLVLNAAAVAGLGRFLFGSGPLWQSWTPTTAVLPSSPAAKNDA